MREINLTIDGGRRLHAYDTETGGGVAVFWLHGTPNLGEPPQPLFDTTADLGLRWLAYDRPGYGASSPQPGRTIASAAADVMAVAEAFEVDRFALMGHSGGGSHALGCAAELTDRILGVISVSALAPFEADGLDWFQGMIPSGVASLRAAAIGREAKTSYENSGAAYDPEFTPADLDMLQRDWSWLGHMAGAGMKSGPWGLIDDDIAYVNPWGCDLDQIVAPVLIVHGGQDRIAPSSHARWLATHLPEAELWLSEEDGHISALRRSQAALSRLLARA